MRKWSKIIYSGNGWDMTVRELMFSIVIILIMLMGGFFISEKIASHNDEQNQEYYQAMQIDGNAELFQYGMRTDVGNAFVKGNLVAVDPVTDPGIGGVPAAYIKVEEQHYNRHTRQMNELLLEQNSQLKEQNKHLNMVILSVCSKSVRDRKDQEEKREKATERDTPEKETPESSV